MSRTHKRTLQLIAIVERSVEDVAVRFGCSRDDAARLKLDCAEILLAYLRDKVA